MLAQADDGEFNPFAQLICQRVMGTLQTYINAQKRPISFRDGRQISLARPRLRRRKSGGWRTSAGVMPSSRYEMLSSDVLP